MKKPIGKLRRYVGRIALLALGITPLGLAPRLAEMCDWTKAPMLSLMAALLLCLVFTSCLAVLIFDLLDKPAVVPAADPHLWWLVWLRVNLDLMHKRLDTTLPNIPIADDQPLCDVLTMADGICVDLLKHYWYAQRALELLSLPEPWLDIQRPGDPARLRLSHVVVSRTGCLRLGGYPTTANGSPVPNVQQGQIRRVDLNEFDVPTQLTVLRLVVAELHRQWK